MDITRVIKARRMAYEFCKRAELTEALYDKEDADRSDGHYKPGSIKHVGGSGITGSLRRQSMELTRALAEMRKP